MLRVQTLASNFLRRSCSHTPNTQFHRCMSCCSSCMVSYRHKCSHLVVWACPQDVPADFVSTGMTSWKWECHRICRLKSLLKRSDTHQKRTRQSMNRDEWSYQLPHIYDKLFTVATSTGGWKSTVLFLGSCC